MNKNLMTTFKVRHVKFCPIIGIGYWYDKFTHPAFPIGYTHNFFLPFFHIACGVMNTPTINENEVLKKEVERLNEENTRLAEAVIKKPRWPNSLKNRVKKDNELIIQLQNELSELKAKYNLNPRKG